MGRETRRKFAGDGRPGPAAVRPHRRPGQRRWLGQVAFLASDEASFVTGQTIGASGGLTMS